MAISEMHGPRFAPDSAGGPTHTEVESRPQNPLLKMDILLKDMSQIPGLMSFPENAYYFRRRLRTAEESIRGHVRVVRSDLGKIGNREITLEEAVAAAYDGRQALPTRTNFYFSGPSSTKEDWAGTVREVNFLLQALGTETIEDLYANQLFVPEKDAFGKEIPNYDIAANRPCPNVIGASLFIRKQRNPDTPDAFPALSIDLVYTDPTKRAIALSEPLPPLTPPGQTPVLPQGNVVEG